MAPFSLENKKILLVRNDNIGDAILSTPVLQAIKEQFPTAFVGVLCAGYSKEAFKGNPYIDKLYVYEKAKHHPKLQKPKHWLHQLKTMLAIRREKYDYAVSLRSSFSNSNASMVRYSGAKIRIVRTPPKLSQMVHFEAFIEDDNKSKHETTSTFECLKHFGVTDKGYKTFVATPKIEFELDDFVVFHISSRLAPNRISVEKFKELSKLITSELGLKVVVTAAPNSPEEKKAKELFNDANERCVQTASLQELGAVIKLSKAFISLDGGAMHLGAAMGVPVLALFGKTNEAQWHPYCDCYTLLKHPSKLAQNIEVGEIFEALKALLLKFKQL